MCSSDLPSGIVRRGSSTPPAGRTPGAEAEPVAGDPLWEDDASPFVWSEHTSCFPFSAASTRAPGDAARENLRTSPGEEVAQREEEAQRPHQLQALIIVFSLPRSNLPLATGTCAKGVEPAADMSQNRRSSTRDGLRPPPGNRILSLAGTAAADFPPPANSARNQANTRRPRAATARARDRVPSTHPTSRVPPVTGASPALVCRGRAEERHGAYGRQVSEEPLRARSRGESLGR